MLIALGALVIGSVGLFFGRLIKAAVSRQREYLADASAVQFTRNPDGIAGALKKIGGLGGRITNGDTGSRNRQSHVLWQCLPVALVPALCDASAAGRTDQADRSTL